MNNNQNKLEKVCTFYVSDFHLSTMLLPYISKKIEEKTKVIGVLEYSLKDSVEMLLSRLNLNKAMKKEIEKIEWESKIKIDNHKFRKQILKAKEDKIIILVNGKERFINLINEYIEEIFKYTDKYIKIINCYQMEEFGHVMKDVLDKHDLYLNTSGEKDVELFKKTI